MTTLRYRAALNEALREELQRDPRVFIGEDLRTGGYVPGYPGYLPSSGTTRLNTPSRRMGSLGVALGCASRSAAGCRANAMTSR